LAKTTPEEKGGYSVDFPGHRKPVAGNNRWVQHRTYRRKHQSILLSQRTLSVPPGQQEISSTTLPRRKKALPSTVVGSFLCKVSNQIYQVRGVTPLFAFCRQLYILTPNVYGSANKKEGAAKGESFGHPNS
jgi:hypothetical protein